MSRVYCEELITTLTQEISLTQDRRYHIPAISLGIVFYNAPSGTFTVSVKSGSTTLVSDTFTSAELKSDLSTSNDYGYLKKEFQFTSDLILEKGTYDIELSSSGYTFSESSFIGWIKPASNIFITHTTNDSVYTNNPFDILIYERKKAGTRWL